MRARRASTPSWPAYAALEARDPARMGATWLPILESVPLFEGLSRRHLRGVEALARTKRYRPGTAVVREGEPGESFRVVLEGGGRDRDQ